MIAAATAAIDTSALLALASSRDQYHRTAVDVARRFRTRGGRWIATTLVLGELHGHLLKRIGPAGARRVVEALLADPIFVWHDASVELVRGAMDRWITRFADQRFSLTDAVTFELMRMMNVRAAFAFDRDFTTAGYVLLD
ncbi:MAG TPA: PIN domain-containing protein [Gemmatimonadaceae bacterium]|nr:PIN domain-containing protein [Gemmatimonadaceae bacterium]